MDASDQLFRKPKLRRYSTSFSRLLMLILDMSEEQQLFLLNQAKHIDLGGEIIWSSNYAVGVKFNNLPRRRTEMIEFFTETEVNKQKAS